MIGADIVGRSRCIASMAISSALLAAWAPTALARNHPSSGGGGPPRVQLLSRSLSGGFPNGPSHNGVFSGDRQLATLAAFDSAATNLVRAPIGAATNVYVVHRARPYSTDGEPWLIGPTELVSRAPGGGAANGPSYRPDLDGDQRHGPRCVAFVSAASNLVPGDTNGVPDAFVEDLRTHRVQRVSLNSDRQQADGATYEVKVDGACRRVAFVSDATNLALTRTRTRNPGWRTAVTGQPPARTRQVYVRVLEGRGDNNGLRGLTFLASSSGHGQPANADADEVAFARAGGGCGHQHRCGDFSGEAVFFASRATNLAGTPAGALSNVYERRFPRRFTHTGRAHLRGVGPLELSTRLISAGRGGVAANGSSSQPATNDSGSFVAFATNARDLVPGGTNGTTQVVRLDLSGGGLDVVSRSSRGANANGGPSGSPSMGRTGQDILFQSSARNLERNNHDCSGDIYHRDFVHGLDVFASLDSSNAIPNSPYGTTQVCPPTIAAPAERPAASYYLNYALYEASFPLIDLPLAHALFPHVDRTQAARLSLSRTDLHQLYLRYLGPR